MRLEPRGRLDNRTNQSAPAKGTRFLRQARLHCEPRDRGRSGPLRPDIQCPRRGASSADRPPLDDWSYLKEAAHKLSASGVLRAWRGSTIAALDPKPKSPVEGRRFQHESFARRMDCSMVNSHATPVSIRAAFVATARIGSPLSGTGASTFARPRRAP